MYTTEDPPTHLYTPSVALSIKPIKYAPIEDVKTQCVRDDLPVGLTSGRKKEGFSKQSSKQGSKLMH